MSRYTLVYGVRLVPEGSVTGLEEARLRRALDRSLDAFFDLLPGAEEDDVEAFGDS